MNTTLAYFATSLLAPLAVLAPLSLLWNYAALWRENARARGLRQRAVRRTGGKVPPMDDNQQPSAGPRGTVFPLAAGACAAWFAISPAAGQTAAEVKPDAGATLPVESPPQESQLTISTDRPGFSDGTGIMPIKHVNLETGYTFTFSNRGGGETQEHNAPEILLRTGLIQDRLELRLGTAGFSWSRADAGDGEGFASNDGWNDLVVGAKLKVTEQDKFLPLLAIEAATTLGAGSDGVSSQTMEPTFKLLWSYDVGHNVTLGGNLNVAFTVSDGERFTQGQGSLYVQFPVTQKVSGFAEYYVLWPNSKHSDAAHYIDFGGTYLITPRVQLDASLGFGLNNEADTLFTGFGISFLF